MQAEIHSWERSLLSLAQEAHHTHTPHDLPVVDEQLLEAAYAWCDIVTARNSRSFHLASSLLPLEKRRAVRALYAFCRVTDDIVDRPQAADRFGALENWRRTLHQNPPPANDLVAVAWADARRRFQVPARYAEQLLEGVARDMYQVRYETFDDLAGYSYGVASTVGLMSMHIIGYKAQSPAAGAAHSPAAGAAHSPAAGVAHSPAAGAGNEAIPYAIKLGVALQVTNILRDVGEDWRNGRLYLPLEDLERFGVTEQDVEMGVRGGDVSERWIRLMQFQIERNRRLYAEAWPGIALLERDGRFAIAAAADLYRAILVDIERNGYNNFTRRAHVGTAGKLSMLPAIWWRSRRASVPSM